MHISKDDVIGHVALSIDSARFPNDLEALVFIVTWANGSVRDDKNKIDYLAILRQDDLPVMEKTFLMANALVERKFLSCDNLLAARIDEGVVDRVHSMEKARIVSENKVRKYPCGPKPR